MPRRAMNQLDSNVLAIVLS